MIVSHDLILASSSRYRVELLTRLGLPFKAINHEVDEEAAVSNSIEPSDRALVLARAKTNSVAQYFTKALIIGCDQVAASASVTLHKPRDRASNIEQLELIAGQKVCFYSALCVKNTATGEMLEQMVPFFVWLRPLDRAQIEIYVDREQAFDCAGGFKAENLGIALCERMEGTDPTALIGLPLICLTRLLALHGVDVLCNVGRLP